MDANLPLTAASSLPADFPWLTLIALIQRRAPC